MSDYSDLVHEVRRLEYEYWNHPTKRGSDYTRLVYTLTNKKIELEQKKKELGYE